MNKKILALGLLLLLTTVYIGSALMSSVKAAGEGQWITSYKIEDATTGQTLVSVDYATGANTTFGPVLPGSSLKVTFTIDVITSGSGNLQLTTSEERHCKISTGNSLLKTTR